jgi:hypothetical protein
MSGAEQDAAHRAGARVLHADRAPPGLVAAHLKPLRSAADAWVVERLRAAARAAIDDGAPAAAADLLDRALAEPPPSAIRVELLREAARAEQLAGREGACRRLEEALVMTADKPGVPDWRRSSRRLTRRCSTGPTPSRCSRTRSLRRPLLCGRSWKASWSP